MPLFVSCIFDRRYNIAGKIKLSAIFTWETVCMALAFVAMLYSTSFSVFGGTYYAMIVNFILVFILTQMPWTEKRFNMVMTSYAVVSAGLIIVLVLTDNLRDSSETGRLGQDLAGNANVFAMMLMVSAIYAIWRFFTSKRIIGKLIFTAALGITYIGMLLSGGRKYVVVPLIFAYILMLSKNDKKGKKHILRSTAVIAVLLVSGYFLIMRVPVFYEVIGQRFEGAFALFDSSYEMDGSTRARQEMIEYGFSQWKKQPVWGYGFDSFKDYNALYVTGNLYYSHNNFIELLFNQGVIGFIAYYALYIYLFVKALKSKADSLNKGFIFGSLLSILFFEYFGVTYYTTPIQILLFFAYYNLSVGEKSETI